MAGILIPQDYQMPEDMKGKRKKVRPEDIRSGTLYGQYQLRGSILTIKDASTTASGFMAFGTDMTTIPTSATTGTGIYIDYSGIYGLASDVQQAYMRASDGKIVAGAGKVELGANGLTHFTGSAGEQSYIKWLRPSDNLMVGSIIGIDAFPTFNMIVIDANNQINATEGAVLLNAVGGSGNTASFYLRELSGTSAHLYQNGGTLLGLMIGGDATVAPSSLLHLKSSAPTFRMEDTTASAKSLLMKTDGNKTYMQEVAGTDGDLVTLDLANNRLGIGVASPSRVLDVTGTTSARFQINAANGGINVYQTAASSSSVGGTVEVGTNDGAAMASLDRLGQFIFAGHDGTTMRQGAFIISYATENWSSTARGNKFGFYTCPNGSTVPTLALWIEQDQQVSFQGNLSIADGKNIEVNTSTGTKIGTSTTQKLGFFNATPVTQQANTTDLGTVLSNLGFRASGTAYPITTSGAATLTGGVTVNTAGLTITDVDIALGTTTGTKIGTGTTQKLGFYNATPVARPSAYTQTYSAADKTHANFTSSDLTGITSSSTGSALAEPGASYTQSQHQQNYRRIQDQFVKLRADVADLKQLVNSIIDDLQALGLVG